jgi:alpha-1,3-rhamnosyl/mannosyltransferase
MRVLIYAPAARMGGARAHVLGLVPELANIAESDEFLLLAQPDLLADLPALPRSWVLRQERAELRGFFGRLAWEQLALPRVAARWRADVLLSFGSFIPLRAPCPTVLEAGNALPFTRAYWQALRREPVRLELEEHLRWLLLAASLRRTTRILTPTRSMRHDVLVRLPDVAPKLDVVLWGVAPVFHTKRWTKPEGDVILGVSKHGINKEFDVLVRAIPRLVQRWPQAQLVLTGTIEESRWSRRSMSLARDLGVADSVCFAGDVPNAHVPSLIQRSRVLVFPTWCESFGLPLAEALAMGAPAVAADIPACREVGKDAACYYAPGNSESMASAITELLASPEAADTLARRAFERGRTFSWRDNATGVQQSLLKAVA